MIDVKKLRENPEPYRQSIGQRQLKVDLDRLLKIDQTYADLLAEVEKLRGELNVKGKPSGDELKKLQQTKEVLGKKEAELKKTTEARAELLEGVPNLIAGDTPEGGEEASREERRWGEPKKFSFEPQNHLELAEAKGWLDFERGAKVAGHKFYYLKGAAAKLELAVMRFAVDFLEKEGFELMSVPHLVSDRVMSGAGFLPRGEERQVYKIEGEDLNLIATAEIPLTGYHADEIIPAEQLPKLYMGISPSYRREAGAYGKYSQGLYRVHQFDKLEMYVFCKPEESEKWHNKLVELEEKICQTLEIPYRVVRIAAGDLGAPAYKKFDIEYYSPAEGEYRELMSCSNVTDFQARRLNIRLRSLDGKVEPLHTLNGTAAAYSRIFIALVENNQTADGEVELPAVLAKYYGGDKL